VSIGELAGVLYRDILGIIESAYGLEKTGIIVDKFPIVASLNIAAMNDFLDKGLTIAGEVGLNGRKL
jgi:hypothetical protein